MQAGEWEEVEKYLSGYTKVDDNRYSMKIFFEIRKQKYLEALDRYKLVLCLLSFGKFVYPYCKISPLLLSTGFLNFRQDKAKAVEILVSDLKVFSTFNEDLYKEITQLLTLNNFRYYPDPGHL